MGGVLLFAGEDQRSEEAEKHTGLSDLFEDALNM
jgi:hypothetical protein